MEVVQAIAVLIWLGQLIGNIEPLEVSRTELMLKRRLALYSDNEDSSDTSDNKNIEGSDSEGESMNESESGVRVTRVGAREVTKDVSCGRPLCVSFWFVCCDLGEIFIRVAINHLYAFLMIVYACAHACLTTSRCNV